MKKLIAFLLCLALVLSMAACGADSKTTQSEPQNTTSKVAEVPATTHQQVVAATTTVAPVSQLPQVPGIDFQYEIDNFVPDYFNSRTLRVGEKDKAQGEVWLSSGQGSIYTSDENVVTVATNGTVTAVGEGTAYVLVVGIGNMHEITRYEVKGK